MKTPSRSILQVIEDRIADPTYIPTGPTYGEVVPLKSPEEQQQEIGMVNWNRAITQERERCARIAEDWYKSKRGARIDLQTVRLEAGRAIAKAIRSAE